MIDEPRSRRSRPAKAPLSRAVVVAETIAIMRREGLDRATMRRVAQALDTGPASLYVYVRGTTELHAAVVDELLGAIAAPAEGTAEVRLRALLDVYLRLMLEYPGLARSALVLRPAGPGAVLLYDQLLGLLIEAGTAPERAAWGLDLLLQYLTATAAEHGAPAPARPAPSGDLGDLRAAVTAADPREAPHVAEHAATLTAGTPQQRLDWALAVLLSGIAVTPLPPGATTPPALERAAAPTGDRR